MKYHFQLQILFLTRRFRESGFHPVFAGALLLIGFFVFSFFLFQKTEYAGYIYVLMALFSCGSFSGKTRVEFLKSNFKDNQWRLIRVIENWMVCIPFFCCLLVEMEFLLALSLLVFSALIAILKLEANWVLTIPTPFYKYPFEFVIGFRNVFYLFFVSYILTAVAIQVDNFNLGIFSMLVVFAVSLSFYSNPEEEFYVWNFSLNPQQFIRQKLKSASIQVSLLVFPIVVTLSVFYFELVVYVLLFLLLGYCFLMTMILAKYSVYPNKMSLLESLLLVFCIPCPPLLLFVFPYFYGKSKEALKSYLQ